MSLMYKKVLKDKKILTGKKIQIFKKTGSVSVFHNGINTIDEAIFRLEQILKIHAARKNEKILGSSKFYSKY